MNAIEAMVQSLSEYRGAPLKFMEVCGTHTATAAKGGIRSLLPAGIRLISGPGCPVCLAASAYIDRLCTLAEESCVIASFGDLLKVRGTRGSLLDAKARGGRIEMIYSPHEALRIAQEEPDKTVVAAAVGFETTAPAYALLLQTAMEKNITNIRLLTALKRLIPALEALCGEGDIDGFIAPGHVAAVLGSDCFAPLAERFGKPFVVAGFTPENMLAAISLLVKKANTGFTANLYGEVVRPEGNIKALTAIDEFFVPGETYWRGLSVIGDSGYYLKEEYGQFDAGSRELYDDKSDSGGCRCGEVLTGKLEPAGCPLFGKGCTPENAFGPCMVSAEGACGIWYREGMVYDH